MITHHAYWPMYKPVGGVLWSWVAVVSHVTATVCVHRLSSDGSLNTLNGQIIPSMDVFFLDGMVIFQDDNASRCQDSTSWIEKVVQGV